MPYIREIHEVLASAGWAPGRQVDITEYERWCALLDFTVVDAAREVMREYGELVVDFHLLGSPRLVSQLNFTFEDAVSQLSLGEECQAYLGEAITPVAELEFQHASLFVTASGRFYGLWDVFLSSFEGGIEDVITELVQGGKGRWVATMQFDL